LRRERPEPCSSSMNVYRASWTTTNKSGRPLGRLWSETACRQGDCLMTRVVVLDTGPLGMIAHPKKNPAVGAWIRNLVQDGNKVVVPEIADYEVRRELLRAKMSKSVKRLDRLKTTLYYLPLTTP